MVTTMSHQLLLASAEVSTTSLESVDGPSNISFQDLNPAAGAIEGWIGWTLRNGDKTCRLIPLPGTIRIGRAAAEARSLSIGLKASVTTVDLMSANPGRIQLEKGMKKHTFSKIQLISQISTWISFYKQVLC